MSEASLGGEEIRRIIILVKQKGRLIRNGPSPLTHTNPNYTMRDVITGIAFNPKQAILAGLPNRYSGSGSRSPEANGY